MSKSPRRHVLSPVPSPHLDPSAHRPHFGSMLPHRLRGSSALRLRWAYSSLQVSLWWSSLMFCNGLLGFWQCLHPPPLHRHPAPSFLPPSSLSSSLAPASPWSAESPLPSQSHEPPAQPQASKPSKLPWSIGLSALLVPPLTLVPPPSITSQVSAQPFTRSSTLAPPTVSNTMVFLSYSSGSSLSITSSTPSSKAPSLLS